MSAPLEAKSDRSGSRQEAAVAGDGHVAVIDIGSNSIRLAVFDAGGRALWPMFNEKVLCGLARGLSTSGRLDPEGAELARRNLVRFTRLARAMGVGRIDLLATAAVREAGDGAEFVADIERLCGLSVRVLDGAEEAHLSALGVIAGRPEAEGVMGDLGGGSLELVEFRGGRPGRWGTLALGPFRLMETCAGDFAAMRREVDRALERGGWLGERRSPDVKPDRVRTFYPVGGAWRNLARIHMKQCGYPLHVVHGYRIQRADVEDLSRLIGDLSPRSLGRIQGVTKRRLETLPAAALVLGRVIAALDCQDVTFSAFGLREGHAYNLLPETERARDPLIAVTEDIAAREARFDDLGHRLAAWTEPLFPGEDAADRRLRQASCLLSDIAWREHPDYRADQALRRILYFPFMGIGHAERVFLGYAAFTRYGGAERARKVARYPGLIAPEAARRARVLGLAQRLAYQVSGATRAVLARSALKFDGRDDLRLILPDDGTAPRGAAVERRFQALATALRAGRATIEG